MKYTPNGTDNFNAWYKEFHLLFEDNHGSQEEVMEVAKSCYDKAGEVKSTLVGTLAGELLWCMDNLKPVKGSGMTLKGGVVRSWKNRIKDALETIPGVTVTIG